MLRGRALFQEVDRTSEGGAFWWLGQYTFVVKRGPAIVLIDPFLSDF